MIHAVSIRDTDKSFSMRTEGSARYTGNALSFQKFRAEFIAAHSGLAYIRKYIEGTVRHVGM